MAKIRFSNGKVVNFNGTPTQEDIEEVASQFESVQPQEPQTLAGQALNQVKRLNPFPLTPSEFMKVPTSPVTSTISQDLERQGEKVESSINDISGRIAESGNPLTATLLSLNAGALKPSSMMVGTGMGFLGGMAATAAKPMPLRFPSTTERGFKNAMVGLGGESLEPTQLAEPVISKYQQNVEQPLVSSLQGEQIIGKRSMLPTTPIQTPEQVFKPKYSEVAGQISPEPSTFQKAGTIAIDRHFGNIGILKDVSNKAWEPLNEELPKIKGDLTPAVNYVRKLFSMGDEGMGEGNVNVRLSGSSNESGIPISVIRQQYPDYMPPPAQTMQAVERANPAMPARDYGIFAKVLEMGQKENLTAADIQAMKSYVGRNIAEHGNVLNDKFNHDALGMERALNESLINSVEKSGAKNTEALMDAKSKSKALYEYSDLYTSEIMQKAKTPEDAMNRLMSSPTRIQEFFDSHNFTPEEKGQFQRAVLDKMAEKGKNTPDGWVKEIGKMPADKKSAIFGDKIGLVDSISDTVPKLQAEIAKTKMQLPTETIPAQTKADVLGKEELLLNNIMTNSRASELVDNIYADGSQELAKTLSNTMDDDSMSLLQRGIIQKIINKNKLPKPNGKFTLNMNGLTNDLNKMNPEFIREFFGGGNKAQQVIDLRDATRFFTTGEYDPIISGSHIGEPVPFKLGVTLKKMFTQFRLNSQVNKLISGTAEDMRSGSEFANKVAPTMTKGQPLPTDLGSFGRSALTLPLSSVSQRKQ